MNKQEFIAELRVALSVELGAALVEENVRYYENYISTQIQMGKSEDQVMSELGNPRLIAKSIVEAVKSGENIGSDYKTAQNENGGAYYRDTTYRDTTNRDNRYGGANTYGNDTRRTKIAKLPTWLIVLLVVGIICIVIGLLVAVVWWLAPVILVIWFVTFLFKMLKNNS